MGVTDFRGGGGMPPPPPPKHVCRNEVIEIFISNFCLNNYPCYKYLPCTFSMSYLQPNVAGIRVPTNPLLCPLCLGKRVEPTTIATSGYVPHTHTHSLTLTHTRTRTHTHTHARTHTHTITHTGMSSATLVF